MQGNFTNIRSLLNAFAQAMNLINPDMQHHHDQTAFLAYLIAYEMGLRDEQLNLVMYTALMHDIGSTVVPESKAVKQTAQGRKQIAKIGASMIREVDECRPVVDIVEIIQNSYTENSQLLKNDVRLDISQAVHLSDFVTTALRDDMPILSQVENILTSVEQLSGSDFSPKAVEAFRAVSKVEALWLDVAFHPAFLGFFTGKIRGVSLDEVVIFTRLMSRIIDFKSPFTAMHSAGVAATARELARLAGMGEDDVKMMEIAGNLHDVGKLRVPNEILEKPGKLTEEEFNIMKEHTYYTRMILGGVDGFEKIAAWAAFHHEKLNGKGYPFHLDGTRLDVGARIMAVADIFSAIAEVRPYREGMKREQALSVLKDSVEKGEICGWVVSILEAHYEAVDAARERESRAVGKRYFQSLAMKE